MYRLYVEDFSCEEVWTIDAGPGTAMRRFRSVISKACGISKVNLQADNKEDPKAWLEYENAELKIFGTTALLR